MLYFIGESGLNIVLPGLAPEHELDAFNMRFQVVARVLEIGAHTEVL